MSKFKYPMTNECQSSNVKMRKQVIPTKVGILNQVQDDTNYYFGIGIWDFN